VVVYIFIFVSLLGFIYVISLLWKVSSFANGRFAWLLCHREAQPWWQEIWQRFVFFFLWTLLALSLYYLVWSLCFSQFFSGLLVLGSFFFAKGWCFMVELKTRLSRRSFFIMFLVLFWDFYFGISTASKLVWIKRSCFSLIFFFHEDLNFSSLSISCNIVLPLRN